MGYMGNLCSEEGTSCYICVSFSHWLYRISLSEHLYMCLSLFTGLVPIRLVEILVWVIQSNLGLSLQTVDERSRTFSLDLHTWVGTKGALETRHCGNYVAHMLGEQIAIWGDSHKKTWKGVRSRGMLEGWTFFLPDPCFCITKQWVSQIRHKQTLPFPRTEWVMQGMTVFAKWALTGTSQNLNIHYLQLSGT